MKSIISIILALLMLGCGEDKMATIGEETEIDNDSIITNVTDDTPYYDTTSSTVSADLSRNSFIIKSGTLWGTGDNSSGQLGLGDTTDRNVFTDTGVTDVRSVFNGRNTTFIIKTDGSVWAAGYNSGKFGNGTSEDSLVFININLTDVKTISSDSSNTFIIKNDGTLWATGRGQSGVLGLGTKEFITSFTDTGITSVKTIALGSGMTMLIKNDGTLWATGDNSYGGLGLGDTVDRNVFTDTGITSVKTIALGSTHSLIFITNGTLWATGRNLGGQLGLGDNTDRNVFTNTGITSVNIIAGLDTSTIILKDNGTIWSTGSNGSGQLGLGDTTDRNVFTDTGVTSVKSVFGGLIHAMLIKNDGTLWATGYNNNGELGLGDTTSRSSFTDTSEVPDSFVLENWTPFYNNDIVRIGNFRYVFSLLEATSPGIFGNLTQIGAVNELKPFDGQNITPLIFASPMTYTIKGTEPFNSFTLAKVLATSVAYTFKNSAGATIKTATSTIDCKRDKDGILSLYPTTVSFYAGQQMEANSTVEITLTHTTDVELGDFTLNNAIDAGFTNLVFKHGIEDYNTYTPDAFGNIPESTKAIVTTFDIIVDVLIENYDYMVSFRESIAGKNVMIDASDSNGEVANGSTIFASLTRRVRMTSMPSETNIKDGELGRIAKFTMSAQEIV